MKIFEQVNVSKMEIYETSILVKESQQSTQMRCGCRKGCRSNWTFYRWRAVAPVRPTRLPNLACRFETPDSLRQYLAKEQSDSDPLGSGSLSTRWWIAEGPKFSDRQCSAQFSSHMQILLTIIILLLFAVNISCKILCVKFSWLTATTKLILATKFPDLR